MRVLHVTPAFYPATFYGGPLVTVHRLCEALGAAGAEVAVLTTDADGPGRRVDMPADRDVPLGPGLTARYCRSLGPLSPGLLAELPARVRWAEVVHVTAAYSFHVIPTLAACRALGRPVVWSPRGALQRWSGTRRRLLKAAWERACAAVAPSRCVLHVTAEPEARDSGARFPHLPVALVANGIDIPPAPRRAVRADPTAPLCLLYLGRLDPIKGLENLLRACAQLQRSTWSLVVAGAGTPAYTANLRSLAASLGIEPSVRFVGHLTGPAKEAAFEAADLVVVPSFSENFGLVVAEALARARPVVAARGTPWQGVESHRCGRWVDNDPPALAAALTELMRAPLGEMGARGRRWMEQEHAWPTKAAEMLAVYERLLSP